MMNTNVISTLFIALFLLATTAASLAVSSTSEEHRSTWMLLEVTHDGNTRVVAAKKSHQVPSRCKGHPLKPNDHVIVEYTHPETGETCSVPFANPRKLNHDNDAGNGKFSGGVQYHDAIEFAVTVHKDVDTLHTFDYKNPHMATRHFVTEEHHRAYDALQTAVKIDTTKINATVEQIVGPTEEQFNIVFISSGYTSAEKDKFDEDVAKLKDFMQKPIDGLNLNSQPFRRYFSMTNIYKVWHPSTQSGASHPAPAGDGTVVDNNLDCAYGSTSARSLSCSRAKVQMVGSHAPPDPANTLLMVIVNDKTFGGTGGAKVCTTYNGEKMYVIFIHEVGHAQADLADEYDYGTVESKQIDMINCHWKTEDVPWQDWIDSGVLPPLTQVCTYTNYYKPTPGACLMESDQKEYCMVCNEAVLKSMYDHGLNLANPMFPNKYETAYVRNGESIKLFINRFVASHRDESGAFQVTWSVDNYTGTFQQNVGMFGFGTAADGVGYFYPGPGEYTVRVNIYDATVYLHPQSKRKGALTTRNNQNATAVNQTHSFRIVVYPDYHPPVNCTQREGPIPNSSYCAVCDPGRDSYCSMNFKSTPLESATDVSGALAGLETWLFGVGAVFVVIGIMIFVLIWRTMALHAEHNPREVLPLGQNILIVRMILLVMQITLLIGACVSIIFSVYMYNQLSIFGRTIVLGVIACSTVVWFASFVGFCASYYKNRGVLFVNFILLLLLFGSALLFTVLLLYMLFNIETEGVKKQLLIEWQDSVKNDPKATCTMQSVLKCSGFNTSCDKFAYSPGGSTDCPANCEKSNLFSDPCYLRVKQFVKDKFGTASIGGLILCVFLLITLVLSLVLGCSIKTRRNKVHRQRRERHANGQSSLTEEEIAMLHNEFRKIDKDGSGDISRLEFSTFYNAVMGSSLSPRELEEYFDKLDADGNGVLSFDEFIKVYIPQKEPKKRSLAKTKSMIYAPDPGFGSPEAAEIAEMPEPSEHPRSVQSQRRAQDIELDLVLDEEIDEDMSPEEVARIQEEQARDEAARVAAAQAERQKRMAMDRPSNIDVDLVLDDMGMNATLGDGNLDDMEDMDLDIDLDNEEFE